jgi:hypothetical protein
MASQMSAILRAGTPLKRRIICVINPKSVYPVANAAKALLAIAPTLIRSIRNKRYKRNENKGTPNAANATTTPWAFSLFCR